MSAKSRCPMSPSGERMLSSFERTRCSLCRSASSTCLRSVMSTTIPSHKTEPSSNRRGVERHWTHLTSPVTVRWRNSQSKGVSWRADCSSTAASRPRSSSTTSRRNASGSASMRWGERPKSLLDAGAHIGVVHPSVRPLHVLVDGTAGDLVAERPQSALALAQGQFRLLDAGDIGRPW